MSSSKSLTGTIQLSHTDTKGEMTGESETLSFTVLRGKMLQALLHFASLPTRPCILFLVSDAYLERWLMEQLQWQQACVVGAHVVRSSVVFSPLEDESACAVWNRACCSPPASQIDFSQSTHLKPDHHCVVLQRLVQSSERSVTCIAFGPQADARSIRALCERSFIALRRLDLSKAANVRVADIRRVLTLRMLKVLVFGSVEEYKAQFFDERLEDETIREGLHIRVIDPRMADALLFEDSYVVSSWPSNKRFSSTMVSISCPRKGNQPIIAGKKIVTLRYSPETPLRRLRVACQEFFGDSFNVAEIDSELVPVRLVEFESRVAHNEDVLVPPGTRLKLYRGFDFEEQ